MQKRGLDKIFYQVVLLRSHSIRLYSVVSINPLQLRYVLAW